MSFPSLVEAALISQRAASYSRPKCCILTNSGGCRNEASKFAYQNLVSKFELYHIDPPMLKANCEESSRVCKSHYHMSPKLYEQERPAVTVETVVDFLEREEELERKKAKREKRSQTKRKLVEDDDEEEEEEEEKGNQDEEYVEEDVDEESSSEQPFEGKPVKPEGGTQLQERHCIYLKKVDDEKCKRVAKSLGLARGNDGYNRSALLAKVPQLVDDNKNLKEKVMDLGSKLNEVLFPKTSTNVLPQLPNLVPVRVKEEPSAWVLFLAESLSEQEMDELLDLYKDGKLRKWHLQTEEESQQRASKKRKS